MGTLGNLGTDYKFTGQREEASLGIYFFNARWMDPSLGRFTSPDTIVPTGTQGTQAWDRYAFVNNNPVNNIDPSGHSEQDPPGESNAKPCDFHTDPSCPGYYKYQMGNYGWTFKGYWSDADLKVLYQVALDIIAAVGTVNVMMAMFGAVTFKKDMSISASAQITGDGEISVNRTGAFGYAHELGHIWDQNIGSGGELSTGLQNYTGAVYPTYVDSHMGKYVIDPGSPGNGPGATGWPEQGSTTYPWNKGEDFAQSFAAYIYPGEAATRLWNNHHHQQYGGAYNNYYRYTPRGNYIANNIPWPWK